MLEDKNGRLWAVDHGVSFNVDPKLRTVIWQFAGEELGPQIRGGLERLGAELDRGKLRRRLGDLLSGAEVEATSARVDRLLAESRFPAPRGERPLPWPLI